MIIDLTAEREKREAPDPEFVQTDDYGRKLYAFAVSYTLGGREHTHHIWAYGWPDAEARVAAMRESLVVDGQVYHCEPAQ